MQYLLNQLEYDSLREQAEIGKRAPSKRDLQAFCTRVANEMPVRWTFGAGKVEPKPWGCILTKTDVDWYCDQCPARRICPHPEKEFSK